MDKGYIIAMKDLYKLCQSLGYTPIYDEKIDENTFVIEIPIDEMCNWDGLVRRLNIFHGDLYSVKLDDVTYIDNTGKKYYHLYVCFKSTENFSAQESIMILIQALSKKEHITEKCSQDKYYDLKLGYSCNNNCIHCVIKPNLMKIQMDAPDNIKIDTGVGMHCSMDLSYTDIIKLFQSCEFKDIGTLVITGGEPTIRRDFIDILKWLYYYRSDIKVYIQTNGRLLSDINLVKAIRRYSRNIHFVIAIHGTEKTHNFIVNNRKEKGNPYLETMQGILNIKNYFSDYSAPIRIEMVLSNYNYPELPEIIRAFHEEYSINDFGFSYPHLEGFMIEKINEVAPSFADLVPYLKTVNDYLKIHSDLSVAYEEIPECIHKLYTDNLLLKDMGMKRKNISVNFLGAETNNFYSIWLNSHKKNRDCWQCESNDSCVGVWHENFDINCQYLKPIGSHL